MRKDQQEFRARAFSFGGSLRGALILEEGAKLVNRGTPWAFAAPAMIVFAALVIYPALEGAVLAFRDVGLESLGDAAAYRSAPFIGFRHYHDLFLNPSFTESVLVLFRFSLVTTVIEVAFALALALAFEFLLAPGRFVRTLLLVPMFVIPLVSGLSFRYLLDPNDGVVGELARAFDFRPPELLGSESAAFWLVVLQDFWRMWPFVFLILLAGLKTIPKDLLEAFFVDGGTKLQSLRRIVLPLLMPSLGVAVGLKIIESLKAFTEIYTMTGGGPGFSTTVLSMFIVREGFEFFNLPGAAAAGTLLLMTGLSVALVYTLLKMRGEEKLQ